MKIKRNENSRKKGYGMAKDLSLTTTFQTMRWQSTAAQGKTGPPVKGRAGRWNHSEGGSQGQKQEGDKGAKHNTTRDIKLDRLFFRNTNPDTESNWQNCEKWNGDMTQKTAHWTKRNKNRTWQVETKSYYEWNTRLTDWLADWLPQELQDCCTLWEFTTKEETMSQRVCDSTSDPSRNHFTDFCFSSSLFKACDKLNTQHLRCPSSSAYCYILSVKESLHRGKRVDVTPQWQRRRLPLTWRRIREFNFNDIQSLIHSLQSGIVEKILFHFLQVRVYIIYLEYHFSTFGLKSHNQTTENDLNRNMNAEVTLCRDSLDHLFVETSVPSQSEG